MVRTAKQVLKEQQQQAEHDRVQKAPAPKKPPAVPATVASPTLPAVTDRQSVENYLAETAPNSLVGRLIKFDPKQGHFVFADDDEAVPENQDFVALCDQTAIAYVKFNGQGEPPTRVGGLLYDGFVLPPRTSLGDNDRDDWPAGLSGQPEDPWKHENLLVLRQPKTLELFTFSTMSKTGRRAVGNLLKHYNRMRQTNPGAFPVIRCKPSGYQDSRYGWVPTPLFVTVGVAAGHSTEVPDTSPKGDLNDGIGF